MSHARWIELDERATKKMLASLFMCFRVEVESTHLAVSAVKKLHVFAFMKILEQMLNSSEKLLSPNHSSFIKNALQPAVCAIFSVTFLGENRKPKL